MPYNFVIADRGDERYIGQLDMFQVDWRLRCGELGMVIGSASDRGQGLGREALELMKHFAFRTLGLERLEMEVHMENHAARKCYQKAGFVMEGVKRHAFFTDGRFCDVGHSQHTQGRIRGPRMTPRAADPHIVNHPGPKALGWFFVMQPETDQD